MNKCTKQVCVTGGSGFIGSRLVKMLLEKGYSVNATVQNLEDEAKTAHLQALLSSTDNGRLKLFQADLLNPEQLCSVINGCSDVFHVASPCPLEDPKYRQSKLLEPAINGTINVLEASRKAGVKRVVLTASVSAMVPNPNWPKNKLIEEYFWTDIENCKKKQKWYPASKTLAEKAAWCVIVSSTVLMRVSLVRLCARSRCCQSTYIAL